VAGGLRITEPAADLAVAAALISALADMPLPKQCVVFGEVALSGEVRPAGRTDLRLKEAAKLGFVAAFAPPQKKGGSGAVKVKQIGHIADLAAAIGVEADT
jgi:DNA repair protein RadA/Sms